MTTLSLQNEELLKQQAQLVAQANQQQATTVIQAPIQEPVFSTSSDVFGPQQQTQDDSLFSTYTTKPEEEKTTISREQARAEHDEIIANLQEAGVKTTGLREGEVNFAEYGAALSDEVKQMILDSFDCEADYILQQEILALFTQNNDIKIGDFIRALSRMGYKVTQESVSTSYIIDDKKSAAHGGGTLNEHGRISIFTITDPATGAEIKIADTNGNGAIEAEEVIMNQFLEGVSSKIDTSNFQRMTAAGIYISSDINGVDVEGELLTFEEKIEEDKQIINLKERQNALLRDYTRKYLHELVQNESPEEKEIRSARVRSGENMYTIEELREARQKAEKELFKFQHRF